MVLGRAPVTKGRRRNTMTVECFTQPMPEADYPAAPVFPSHRDGSWSVPSHRSKGDSRGSEPDTLPWPDTYGITWEDQIGVELRELGEQVVPRPLTAGDGDIGKRRAKYRCVECYPSYLASKYRRFPWSFTVSLSAPAGCFEDWWERAGILSGLARLVPRGTSVLDMIDAPFWLGVFAWQPSTATAPQLLPVQGELHAHLVVGNVSRVLLDSVLARWPEQGRFCVVKPITNAWGAVHYCLSQTRIARQRTGESYARYMNRVKSDHMKGQDALGDAPFDSDLELREVIMKLQTTFKATRARTPEATARFQDLAARRWPLRIACDGVLHELHVPVARPTVKLAALLYTLAQTRRAA
jgi:hypothetical protein